MHYNPPEKKLEQQIDQSPLISRDLSWVKFNYRVLDQAKHIDRTIFERLKFMAITASNLDEFFMIRVSGLKRQLARGTLKAPPDGLTPAQQLAEIRERLLPMLDSLTRCLLFHTSN